MFSLICIKYEVVGSGMKHLFPLFLQSITHIEKQNLQTGLKLYLAEEHSRLIQVPYFLNLKWHSRNGIPNSKLF